MSKTLAILGAGHLGLQIAHFAITDNHYSKVVFFDDFSKEDQIHNYPILGNSSTVEHFFKKGDFDELIIGIGYKHLGKKAELFQQLKKKIPFATIIHSTVWVDPTAKIAQGCVIYPNSCIDQRAEIKSNTILNLSCTIAHDSSIGESSFLSPNVAVAGFCSIGDQNFIGINSTIIDNIITCNNNTIGAGSVIIKNIVEPGTYIGSPAKKIK